MKLRTTSECDRQIVAIDDWWRQNRLAAPNLFMDELADVFAMIEAAPMLGRAWTLTEVPGVRRVLMRATRHHVYFSVHGEDVIVLAVWGAVRGRGPRL